MSISRVYFYPKEISKFQDNDNFSINFPLIETCYFINVEFFKK